MIKRTTEKEIEAAKAAGMQVGMIPDKRMDDHLKLNSTFSLASLDEFNPSDFGLPGYKYTPVTHVIFDMDGLLLDTQEIYSSVGANILQRHGKTPDWEFKMKVIGREFAEASKMIVDHYSLPYTETAFIFTN